MPAAIIILPSTIIQNSSPANVSSEPADARSRNAVDEILGPNLSVSSPQGICIAVYVQK